MANKDSTRDKHRSKHKKSKSEKQKKHKKHKKEKKEKKVRSDSSDSKESKKDEIQEPLKREGWNFFDTILSSSNVKDGKDKSKKRPIPEKLERNVRELNPYWKDGGCGLPTNNFGNKDKLLDQKLSDQGSSSKIYNSFLSSGKSKLCFLKPGEDSKINVSANTFQRNWRKKGINKLDRESEKKEYREEKKPEESILDDTKLLTNEELNKLAAKLMKAEIMGNTALVNKLKAELEAAKKVKKEASGEQIKEKNKEVIIVEKSMKKSYEGKQNYHGSKRQKINTHDSQVRVCYFPDDDKYSLKNLFEKEKMEQNEQIPILNSKLSEKNPEELDDIYLEAAASNKMQKKIEERQHQQTIKEATAKHKALEGCSFCIDNRSKTKHLIVSTGENCYLCLPEVESLVPNHCLIVPLRHEISTLHLDEDILDEMKTYQRVLTKMFLDQDQDVVFFENARSFKHHPHCFIQCVPMEKEIGDMAPVYFQKAIAESESEWSMNKKVVDFRNKNLQKCIPKGLPYFAVSFGTDGGFAHVIEDEYLFKRNFGEEVIGGMLDLHHKKWRKPQTENFRNQRQKALEFLKMWKKYEFNENSSCIDSSSSE